MLLFCGHESFHEIFLQYSPNSETVCQPQIHFRLTDSHMKVASREITA